ncbi:hypothetical protein HYPBUDRAFT_85052, partial [Hyphopichia burtonii NRRL Y-1933]
LRVSKACKSCRNQKTKCNGEKPCNRCLKHNRVCDYSESYNQPPNKKVKIKEESPLHESESLSPNENKTSEIKHDSNYINHLENRIQYLEHLLSNNSSSKFKNIEIEEQEGLNEFPKLPSLKWRFSKRHQFMLPMQLNNSIYSSLSEESKRQITLPRMQYFGWNMSGVNYIKSERLPELPEFQLPKPKTYYIDYFFKEINPLFAILHERIVREQIEVYDKLKVRNEKTNQTKLFTAMLSLIYVLSIRFIEFNNRNGPNIESLKIEEILFNYSYKIISGLSFEWESFELIQSWLLITLYLRVSHRQISSYKALKSAISMSESMGLFIEDRRIVNVSPYELLKAKRIFWSAYTFDRLFGLQNGRYSGFHDHQITRKTPHLDDIEKELTSDDWITKPAFLMLQFAIVANFLHTSKHDSLDFIKMQQVNTKLYKLKDWLNDYGFSDDDIFKDGDDEISPVIKTQVKLHFYDVIISFHGPILFNYVGRRFYNPGLKLEMILESCQGIIHLMDQLNKHECFFIPWYQNMLLIFNVGINSITMINGGVLIKESKKLVTSSINLLTILNQLAVIDNQGKIIKNERFNMAKECLWALKTTNHILSLKFKEIFEDINEIGIDHGSSDVNKVTFTQIGYSNDSEKQDKMFDFIEKQRKSIQLSNDNPITSDPMVDPEPNGNPPDPQSFEPNESKVSKDVPTDDFLGNLQWFDQWLDFN